MRVPALLLLPLGIAAAQDVSVYSEFTRIDPSGRPVRADRGPNPPREILSPAIARNAYSSFHLVVEGRPGARYTVEVAQNPEDAVQVTAYRERYTRLRDEWIPDILEPVKLPFEGQLGHGLPDQTAQAFWIDLFAAREAPVRRIKVEPQVFIDEGWIRYPMEVRVTEARLGPTPIQRVVGVGDISQRSSASALTAWVRLSCNSYEKTGVEPGLTIRNFIARNASQDFRFGGGAPPSQLLRLAGVPDRAGLCRAMKPVRQSAEEYLLVRDALIGARE